jgi:L-lysine exporter family protein LysE/ArgO
MLNAFLTGFVFGFSLILAIGAQNSFVLRQGLIGRHVFAVALFCSLSDAILIIIGVAGISIFLSNQIYLDSDWLFAFASIWLAGYGLLKLKDAVKGNSALVASSTLNNGIASTLSFLAILTFANPHVYLDTMVLIGSISQQFSGYYRIAFTLGACLSSFVFFFSLAYGARLLEPLMKRPSSWIILDGLIALIMFTIAFKLASAGNWL